jgi:hypothetical protein
MGAWGHGYFEDDSALDFAAKVEESDQPATVLREALQTAVQADYLESNEGNAVIVAAAYLDRQLHGTRFTPAGRPKPLEVDTFAERHPTVDLAPLRETAVAALRRVLADDSELNELWAENETDYPAWRQGVEQLLQRLGA